MDARVAEVRRLLDRYMVEIVETYDLCPWARPARLGDELGIDVLWGTPAIERWVAAAQALLAQPRTRVAMVVAPELTGTPWDLRAIRDAVSAQIPGVGIAHFHPDSPLDLATPARLVPYLRCSPDPLLQLVPLALLDSVRAAPPFADLASQAKLLTGELQPPRGDVADALAITNHVRVSAETTAIAARLADIAADRLRSYARLGIATSR